MSSQLCTICNDPNAKLCGVCQSSAYCSIECQRTDWPLHKSLCSSFQSFLATSPSANNHRVAILLPADSTTPRLIWVEVEISGRGEDSCHKLLLDEFLGPYQENARVLVNQFRGFDLPRMTRLICRGNGLNDGSTWNQCIGSMVRGIPQAWYGPIVALRQRYCNDEFYQSATLADLRYAADFFRTYGDLEDHKKQIGRGKKILGVRVNCIGDQEKRGVFEQVAVPKDHPFGAVPDLTKLIDLPVRVYRYPIPKTFSYSKTSQNRPIVLLHCGVDPNQVGTDPRTLGSWGFAPMEWQPEVGSVLLVRADGNDLSVAAVSAMCAFVTQEPSLFEASLEAEEAEDEGRLKRAKVETLKVISKAGFERSSPKTIVHRKQLDAGRDEWENIFIAV